jgi:thiol-disulfide isomerase/thioredoxin
MNIKIIFSGLFLTVTLALNAQDVKDILQKTFDKCQSVQNGYFEMTRYMKFMSSKDTSKTTFIYNFKKLKNDTLFSSAFHYKQFLNGEYTSDVIYTGEDLITAYAGDSTATIMAKKLWAKDIRSFSQNYTYYPPLTNRRSGPLPHDSDFIDKNYSFRLIGEENLNKVPCYHIQVNKRPDNDDNEMMKTLRIEYHFWISQIDMIPVQFSTAYDIVEINDTMSQYEKYVLTRFEINTLKDSNILTLSSLPAFYKLKEYTPYKIQPTLPKDTIAPDWQLYSLTGEKISLAGLKGKLVLIDFFYSSCYPCMLALPCLQALHEKYKEKGLLVLGIDPYDKKEDGIDKFLAKRNVTYTVLLGDKDIAKQYRVSGYPTIYLVGKTGKIVFVDIGYGKDFDTVLEKVILDNL